MVWIFWLLMLIQKLTLNGVPEAHTEGAQSAPQAPRLYPLGKTVYSEGRATYYISGLLEHVARKRGIQLDGASGFATYPNCAELGRILMVSVLNPKTGKWSGWSAKRIVDCSEDRDYARHVAEGLVELSYEQALDYGYSGEGHTQIRFYLEGQK